MAGRKRNEQIVVGEYRIGPDGRRDLLRLALGNLRSRGLQSMVMGYGKLDGLIKIDADRGCGTLPPPRSRGDDLRKGTHRNAGGPEKKEPLNARISVWHVRQHR